MNTIYLNIRQAKKIVNSKKAFLVYNLDEQNNVINFRLTDDLKRYYKKEYNNFKLVEILSRKSNKLEF